MIFSIINKVRVCYLRCDPAVVILVKTNYFSLNVKQYITYPPHSFSWVCHDTQILRGWRGKFAIIENGGPPRWLAPPPPFNKPHHVGKFVY